MSRRNAAGGKATTTGAVFGELLKHLRESAGLTQEGLAKRIPCDRSLVARVEAGTRVPQDTFADTCDIVLKTGGTLLHLWARIDWYPEVEHPDWFQRRADMDAEAVALRAFGTHVIPGLLQTEEYARALFSRVAAGKDRDLVEERTRARLSRQQRFLSQDGPLLLAVLDESTIRNAIGGDAVMHGQCAHLLEVGQRPNIRIQVAPADRPDLVCPDTSMSLITLPDGHDWVYSESLDRGHFNDDPSVFARHAQTYDVLRADAPSVRDSAALISEAMEGYGHHGQARSQRGDMDQEHLQRKQRRRLRRGGPRYPRRSPRT
ncbi:Scr1 family TA system antitoxin-like transcriptional regulator [Streptomyces sp. NPDC059991]|uniref:helix-turn-helix domain-containing protein n=1 Tax=unclassified Streptomyces TaxID=2593676 RepID=UPI0036B55BFF